jgi:hypothetical protein
MRFTASTVPSILSLSSSSLPSASNLLHGKRKATDFGSECPKPTKVFINEERMAARMCDLHLDNNNLDWHPDLEHEPWYSDQKSSDHETLQLSQPTPSTTCISNSTARLELCRELQLGLKTKQLLPQVILDELNKPSMQLVLWQPRDENLWGTVQVNNKTESESEVDQRSDVDRLDANMRPQCSLPKFSASNDVDDIETMDY